MSDQASTVVLPARATIADGAALKESLQAALDRGLDTRLDTSAVTTVDTAVYQLLVAFTAALRDQGAAPAWDGASDAFVAGARLLGITGALELDSTGCREGSS